MGAFLSYAVRWTQSLPTPFLRDDRKIPDYTYEELPAGRYIRLLTLQPGDPEDDLICTLAVSSIVEAPPYEALSYVWCDPEDRIPIKCSEGRLDITTNLYSALLHLRLQDHSRVLWADAICINQKDLDERGKQVLLMRRVYSGAQQVLIWLGPESQDDCDAFDVIRWIDHRFPDLEPGQDMFPHREDVDGTPEQQMRKSVLLVENSDTRRWTQFARLFTRLWFERIWVVQEVACATHAIFICGHQQITWDLLLKAVTKFMMYELINKLDHQLRQAVDQAFRNVPLMNSCRESLADHSLTLTEALCQSRNFKSTDSRDKIYALIGLLPEADVPFVPDYRMPCDEIFQRACVQELLFNERLDFLSCTSYDGPAPDHLPSWVPDWSLPVDRIPFVAFRLGFKAGGSSRAEVEISPDGMILIITGKSLCQITRISKLDGPYVRGPGISRMETSETFSEEFGSLVILDLQHRLDWLDECLSISCEGNRGQWTDCYDTPLQPNFLQSLLCEFDGFSGEHTSVEFASQFAFYRRDMARTKQIVERIRADDDTVCLSVAEEHEESDFIAKFTQLDMIFSHQLAVGGNKRKYCRTNDGRVGWVPQRALVGDLICLLYGGTVLHVLRHAAGARDRLVGEAYVQGLMHGEALEMENIESEEFYIE